MSEKFQTKINVISKEKDKKRMSDLIPLQIYQQYKCDQDGLIVRAIRENYPKQSALRRHFLGSIGEDFLIPVHCLQ